MPDSNFIFQGYIVKPNICFFEDRATDTFGPLLYTRPVWELRCGAFTLAEKIILQLGQVNTTFRCRHQLRSYYQGKTDWKWFEEISDADMVLFINGRALINPTAAAVLSNGAEEISFTSGNELVAFRLHRSNISKLKWDNDGIIDLDSLNSLHKFELKATLLKYPWELIQFAAAEIENDLRLIPKSEISAQDGSLPQHVIVRRRQNIDMHSDCHFGAGAILSAENYPIRLEKCTKIGPGVIIDSSRGSVWIADSAEIQAGAIVMGPAYLGPHSVVRPGAKISDGVCLGPHCRVGGEVSASTMIGFSNKQHSGYLGNAYLGEWVNLGAATDNSDLKNNYMPIDVILNGSKINSGSLHVGVFLADFTRTAIHTRLNSGTYIGVGCNIFGNEFPAKSVPSFTWQSESGYQDYLIEKAIETIGVVMSRGEGLVDQLVNNQCEN